MNDFFSRELEPEGRPLDGGTTRRRAGALHEHRREFGDRRVGQLRMRDGLLWLGDDGHLVGAEHEGREVEARMADGDGLGGPAWRRPRRWRRGGERRCSRAWRGGRRGRRARRASLVGVGAELGLDDDGACGLPLESVLEKDDEVRREGGGRELGDVGLADARVSKRRHGLMEDVAPDARMPESAPTRAFRQPSPCPPAYFLGAAALASTLTNFSVMRSLSPMAANFARSCSGTCKVGGSAQTPLG